MNKEASPVINGPGLTLLIISSAALFLELSMIRFINSTVQVMAYFNNFLILSAFLGLGFGSLLVKKHKNLFELFPVVFCSVLLLMSFLDRYGVIYKSQQQVVWSVMDQVISRNLPMPLVVVLVFSFNFMFFVPLGHKIGEALSAFENRLVAYSYDLAGSIIGVLAFGLCSYLRTAPWLWFLVGALLILTIVPRRKLPASVTFLTLGLALSLLPRAGVWSPYYKVSWEAIRAPEEKGGEVLGSAILVDKLRIQDALNFDANLESGDMGGWPAYYQLPYTIAKPSTVLILGAGSGNDATIALRNNVSKVVVVEIDPVIVGLGKTLHPHKPYNDPRVRTVNDDARSFLEKNQETFDLVIMNALDSHLQLPGLSTLRLESFMYTVEAFRRVKSAMHADSVFMVNLSSTRPWMGHRLYWSLTEAFGQKPKLFSTPNSPYGSLAFAFGPDGKLGQIESSVQIPENKDFEQARGIRLSTDDWPHLYLAENRIPSAYLLVIGVIGIIIILAFRWAGTTISDSRNLAFFFFGAGFMLIETRCLTLFALYFGATWVVSAVVISAILAITFCGNFLVMKGVQLPPIVCYAALWAALAFQYFMNFDFILTMEFVPRMFTAGFLFCLPVFFAGLLFSRLFANTPETSTAFGANLLGIVTGGILEYSSMIFGLRLLCLIAGLLYLCALLCDRRATA